MFRIVVFNVSFLFVMQALFRTQYGRSSRVQTHKGQQNTGNHKLQRITKGCTETMAIMVVKLSAFNAMLPTSFYIDRHGLISSTIVLLDYNGDKYLYLYLFRLLSQAYLNYIRETHIHICKEQTERVPKGYDHNTNMGPIVTTIHFLALVTWCNKLKNKTACN